MHTFFNWIARILAGIFAALFVVSLLIALLLVNAETKLFEAKTYKLAFKNQNIYNRMPKLLAEEITSFLTASQCKDQAQLCLSDQPSPLRNCLEQKLGSAAVTQLATGARIPTPAEKSAIDGCTNEFSPSVNPAITEPTSYLKNLTVQDWEFLIAALVPPDEMKTMSEQTLDSLFDFLNGKVDKATVSLRPIKQTLAENSAEAAKRILSTQPECTTEQLLKLGIDLMTGKQITLCNPSQELMSTMMPAAEAILKNELPRRERTGYRSAKITRVAEHGVVYILALDLDFEYIA